MTLFVANIPWGASEDDFRNFLVAGGYGVASVKVVLSPETGRSRGFAFVKFADAASRDRALRELEGASFGGRPLHVAEARAKRSRGLSRGCARVGEGSSRGRGDRGGTSADDGDDYGW